MNPRFQNFILQPSYIILSCVALCAAQSPSWWTERGVLSTNTPNDFAAVTQGQVKNVATNAFLEMNAVLPQFGGAGPTISNLVHGFTDQGNYQPANLGQLKFVATPFYDRLIAIGYTTNYPWASSPNARNDYAVANIGQLKYLFSFDLTLDTDSDGMPDWWELQYFGGATSAVATADLDGDDRTNLQEFQDATDPTDSEDFWTTLFGTVQYAGNQTGLIYVDVYRNETNFIERIAITDPNGGFTTTNLYGVAGVTLKAFMDSNTNGVPDAASEAQGGFLAGVLRASSGSKVQLFEPDDDHDGDPNATDLHPTTFDDQDGDGEGDKNDPEPTLSNTWVMVRITIPCPTVAGEHRVDPQMPTNAIRTGLVLWPAYGQTDPDGSINGFDIATLPYVDDPGGKLLIWVTNAVPDRKIGAFSLWLNNPIAGAAPIFEWNLLTAMHLDLDADNNNGFDPPDRTVVERMLKDQPGLLGKILRVNDQDDNTNGVPGFADGFATAQFDNTGADGGGRFTPLVLEIPEILSLTNTTIQFEYSASDPASVTRQGNVYTPAPGRLRIWTKDGNSARDSAKVSSSGGDFVANNEGYDVSLFAVTNRLLTLYVEGVAPSTNAGSDRITVSVGPSLYTNENRTIIQYPGPADAARVTVIRVDIDTDTDNDGTIEANDSGEDQFEEHAPGRILCVNGYGINTNTDYLAEIKLAIQPTLTTGTAKLEALDGGSRIKVWTTTNKTTEITLPKTYDLATTNPPSSLYIDGIATGKVQLAFSYTAGSGGFTCTDQVAMLIIPTISYAPGKGTNAFVWASLKTGANGNSGNNLGWADATEFENQIKEQGWPTVTWLEDTTGDTDTNFGSCTLANYRGMTNCGIFTVVSHGEEGGHPAVYAEYSTNGYASVSNWISGETNITLESIPPGGGEPGFYYARISSSWISSHWKAAMDANRTISFWSICYSATSNTVSGEDAVKECAGGRWRVGYKDPTTETEAKNTNERLLKRMNGSTDSALKRTAGEAYESGSGYSANAKMDGNDWTTLCPAPLADNAVFPDVAAGNRKGWGCIIFDTYMCSTNAATDALLKTTGCPTSDHRWFGNADGYYGLGFDFDKTGGAATTMRAVADKCRNDGVGGGRELDGNRVTPNNDNRDWSF